MLQILENAERNYSLLVTIINVIWMIGVAYRQRMYIGWVQQPVGVSNNPHGANGKSSKILAVGN